MAVGSGATTKAAEAPATTTKSLRMTRKPSQTTSVTSEQAKPQRSSRTLRKRLSSSSTGSAAIQEMWLSPLKAERHMTLRRRLLSHKCQQQRMKLMLNGRATGVRSDSENWSRQNDCPCCLLKQGLKQGVCGHGFVAFFFLDAAACFYLNGWRLVVTHDS